MNEVQRSTDDPLLVALRSAFLGFLDIPLNKDTKAELAIDEAAIDAVAKVEMEPEERINRVCKFLHKYSVARVKGATATGLARSILMWADDREDKNPPENVQEIVGHFGKLSEMILHALPDLASGQPRSVDSLSSKALWLCYPNSLPILDGNAEHALSTLRRLCRREDIDVTDRFAAFVFSWFDLYMLIVVDIEETSFVNYPYHVRAFDQFLWWLGNPSFTG